MKVRFSDRALAYLRSEQTYLGRFDKRAARATARQIRKAAEIIGDYPHAGEAMPMIPGVRRYVSAPYILDYVETGGAIVILAIRHGRQNPRVPDQNDELPDDFEA
ncbi:type II toxin-antitoxin system RelE/ParE family toxin [Rhizobium herbae]|uniref:Type II toxin-antitoxin system RelE/ParE family toxin n=1 Tax=Rhizobium herbae TaxID=508661 RepID=A0ABS7HAE1_9HYPH|nr:type II toxin-antitoxin system RelE/ParE family toxin [Rhizobium herbae]MBW9064181.1 type II toxin-antitoxin system RelE/ParE family toxin [Rhizobium herbae]